MSKKKFANEPMLYIQQPSIARPEAPMQHHYTTPKRRKEVMIPEANITKQTKQAAPPRKRVKHNSLQQELIGNASEEMDEAIEETAKPLNEQATSERKKQFKEMTLEEKVVHLADSPTYAPKIKCEIKTENKSYRGLVTNFQDGTVFMQVGRRTVPTPIPFDSIQDIRLVGF